jgi:hypothetical protein
VLFAEGVVVASKENDGVRDDVAGSDDWVRLGVQLGGGVLVSVRSDDGDIDALCCCWETDPDDVDVAVGIWVEVFVTRAVVEWLTSCDSLRVGVEERLKLSVRDSSSDTLHETVGVVELDADVLIVTVFDDDSVIVTVDVFDPLGSLVTDSVSVLIDVRDGDPVGDTRSRDKDMLYDFDWEGLTTDTVSVLEASTESLSDGVSADIEALSLRVGSSDVVGEGDALRLGESDRLMSRVVDGEGDRVPKVDDAVSVASLVAVPPVYEILGCDDTECEHDADDDLDREREGSGLADDVNDPTVLDSELLVVDVGDAVSETVVVGSFDIE